MAEIQRMRDSVEDDTAKLFTDAIDKQIQAVASAIAGGRSHPENAVKTTPMTEAYAEAYRSVFMLFAETLYNALESKVKPAKSIKDFTEEQAAAWNAEVAAFLEEHGGQRVKIMNQTTKDLVGRVMKEAQEKGWGPDKAGRELRKKWKDLEIYRGVRIARTEILSASNHGAVEAMRSIDELYPDIGMGKKWKTNIDNDTRRRPRDEYDHVNMNGKEAGLDETFTVNGESLSQPGDFTNGAGAGNVINCRCGIIPTTTER
jgi:hypothetical protein